MDTTAIARDWHSMHPEPADERARGIEVARQFEQVFVQMLVQNLRQSANVSGDEDGGLFGSGPGSDTYSQWFDDKLGQSLAEDGRLGIASVLTKEFERWHQIPKAPPARTQALPPALRGSATMGGIDVAA
jgi:Rod binding domain-containing protein